MVDVFGSYGSGRDVNNSVGVRNIYGAASGATTGQRAGAQTPATAGGVGMQDDGTNITDSVPTGGMFGKPLAWWAVFVVLLVALMWVAKRAGQASEFSNIRLSFYNILTIALAAAVGIGFLKVVFGRFTVPGLSTYVLAL